MRTIFSLGLTLAVIRVAAAATLINFELGPPVITNEYAPLGVVFSGNPQVLNSVFGGQLIIPSGGYYVHVGAPVEIKFVVPGDSSVPATTNFVSFLNNGLHKGGGIYNGIDVKAFALDGSEIGAELVQPVGPNMARAVTETSFSVPGIHRLVLTPIPNINLPIALTPFDDLQFDVPVAPQAVPEPGSAGLAAVVLGLFALRRSRR
jgi:MYXO-CTERM domain-containing protein